MDLGAGVEAVGKRTSLTAVWATTSLVGCCLAVPLGLSLLTLALAYLLRGQALGKAPSVRGSTHLSLLSDGPFEDGTLVVVMSERTRVRSPLVPAAVAG